MDSLVFDFSLIDKALIVFCVQLFCFRIVDVSLATIRTVFTVKGKSGTAALCGFFEVLIWFIVVREALSSGGNHIITAVFYAGGFAAGTLIGGILSEKLINSKMEVQIIVCENAEALEKAIREAGFGLSVVEVKASDFSDKKYMFFTEVESKRLKELKKLVMKTSEKAFITVKETKYVQNGYFIKK
ncbi:MAG: DUF2179 domain-containing protein [Firmicutes bacterium]|nr:DUF2179 domain-containing protein [Bacillota bacterium]